MGQWSRGILVAWLVATLGCTGGGGNTVSGPYGFPVASAIPLWTTDPATAAAGTRDTHGVGLLLTDVPLTQLCKDINATTPFPLPGPARSLSLYVYSPQVPVFGTFPASTSTYSQLVQMDGGAFVVRSDETADGGLYDYVSLDSESGSVTISGVIPPTLLADGGLGGGSVSGSFNVTLSADGGAVPLTGSFSAIGCASEPLFLP